MLAEAPPQGDIAGLLQEAEGVQERGRCSPGGLAQRVEVAQEVARCLGEGGAPSGEEPPAQGPPARDPLLEGLRAKAPAAPQCGAAVGAVPEGLGVRKVGLDQQAGHLLCPVSPRFVFGFGAFSLVCGEGLASLALALPHRWQVGKAGYLEFPQGCRLVVAVPLPLLLRRVSRKLGPC